MPPWGIWPFVIRPFVIHWSLVIGHWSFSVREGGPVNDLYRYLVDLHHPQPHLPRVLMAGPLLSTTCGALGCFIILRRMAFLGDALAHSMLAGVTAGFLLMK